MQIRWATKPKIVNLVRSDGKPPADSLNVTAFITESSTPSDFEKIVLDAATSSDNVKIVTDALGNLIKSSVNPAPPTANK